MFAFVLGEKKNIRMKVSRKEANNSKIWKYVDGLPVYRRPLVGGYIFWSKEAAKREWVVRSLGGQGWDVVSLKARLRAERDAVSAPRRQPRQLSLK